MKKLLLITFMLSIMTKNIAAQNSNKESREIHEIKNIFKDISTNKLVLPFYLNKEDSLVMPAFFISYKYFIQAIKNRGLDSILLEFKLLKPKIRILLQNIILNDTNIFYVQKIWFKGDKINILSDSITSNNINSYRNYIKPIFFNNYTSCYFASFYGETFDSFFLKKKGNHWVFHEYYLSVDD